MIKYPAHNINSVEGWRARAEELEEELRQLREVVFGEKMVVPLEWHLTPMEALMLRTLASHLQCSRAMFIAAFQTTRWDWSCNPKIIDTVMCKMRSKMRPYGVTIDTIWAVGYALQPESRGWVRECMMEGRNPKIPLSGSAEIIAPLRHTPIRRSNGVLYMRDMVVAVVAAADGPLTATEILVLLRDRYPGAATQMQSIRNMMPILVDTGVLVRSKATTLRKRGFPSFVYRLAPTTAEPAQQDEQG